MKDYSKYFRNTENTDIDSSYGFITKLEDEAKEIIMSNLHNGEIMLLHGNSKTNANIAKYLILQEIKKLKLDQFIWQT